MKLLLHIGTGKTGSTTIQSALKESRGALIENGAFFPVFGGGVSHAFLAMLIAEEGNFKGLIKRHFPPSRAHLLEQKRSDWMRRLAKQIESVRHKASVCILSSEHLCLANESEVERLRTKIASMFSSIEVLVYLRDPVDYAVSMYDTALKAGGLPPGPRRPGKCPELHYASVIQRWQKAFGENAVQVRLFERAWLKNEDILDDFCEAAGLEQASLLRPVSKNESMDLLGQEVMRRVNRVLPQYLPSGEINPERRNIARVIAARFVRGEKPTASKELVQEFDDRFGESNEWVRRAFFPERRRLFVAKSRAEPLRLGLSDVYLDELTNGLIELWREKGHRGGN